MLFNELYDFYLYIFLQNIINSKLWSSECINRMKNITVPKSNIKIVETELKSITIAHIYMLAHSPGMVQALQSKVKG